MNCHLSKNSENFHKLKIVTVNVNSIVANNDRFNLLSFMKNEDPDIICLNKSNRITLTM